MWRTEPNRTERLQSFTFSLSACCKRLSGGKCLIQARFLDQLAEAGRPVTSRRRRPGFIQSVVLSSPQNETFKSAEYKNLRRLHGSPEQTSERGTDPEPALCQARSVGLFQLQQSGSFVESEAADEEHLRCGAGNAALRWTPTWKEAKEAKNNLTEDCELKTADLTRGEARHAARDATIWRRTAPRGMKRTQ
ncbi:hypothetical protein GBF38_001321 [Nibea albiflora]|uniref:Uncharacterized protein n=1 Tax=Nibea albiflora TaxID=240163 RepID=A0ACB7EUY2_NIBAL|nr:hypothetical protein GBF38_001321 [Nibea albiflora]